MIRNTLDLTGRSLRAFARQPYYLVVTLVQPVVWLLLFGQLFRRVTDLPGFGGSGGDSYIAYLTPGIVVMTAVFSCGWSGMALVTDMQRGVLDRFLTTPARRGSLIGGSLGFQAVTTLIQSAIIAGLGLATGARFHGGALVMLAFGGCVVLLGSAIASISNAIALLTRQEESVIATSTFLTLPLTFLSTTFLPARLVPGFIQDVSRANPVDWAVTAGRETLRPDVDWSVVASRAGLLAAVALICAWLSTRAFRVYQRSV
jgi:ABC-2 type transport system permease protein